MSDLKAAGSGIREVRIERKRSPDGSVEKDYRLIITVPAGACWLATGAAGTQVVIERVSVHGLVELAQAIYGYVKPTGGWLD